MSWDYTSACLWLLRTSVGGGLLLGVVCLATLVLRQPARRQHVGEWGIVAALLLAVLAAGPVWLPLALPLHVPAIVADNMPALPALAHPFLRAPNGKKCLECKSSSIHLTRQAPMSSLRTSGFRKPRRRMERRALSTLFPNVSSWLTRLQRPARLMDGEARRDMSARK